MDSEVAATTVDLPDCNSHFYSQQERGGSGEKAEDEEHPSEDFQDAREINKVARESVLDEKALQAASEMSQLGVAVTEKDDSQRDAKGEQAQRFKEAQEFHAKSLASSSDTESANENILAEMETVQG